MHFFRQNIYAYININKYIYICIYIPIYIYTYLFIFNDIIFLHLSIFLLLAWSIATNEILAANGFKEHSYKIRERSGHSHSQPNLLKDGRRDSSLGMI